MTLPSGKLTHRISLESIETTKDSNGDTVEEWVARGSCWSEVAPLSAKEFISSSSMNSTVVARITIRHRPDIQSNWRILFRGRYYNIEGVLPDPVSGMEYMTLPVSYGIQVEP